VIQVVKRSFHELGLPIDTFTLAPVMREKPGYVLLVEPHVHCGRGNELVQRVQANLERINEEYLEKCASERLLPVELGVVPTGTWDAMRREKTGARGNYEEYKHPCLVSDLAFAARLTPLFRGLPQQIANVR
jgi:hypothetical protein